MYWVGETIVKKNWNPRNHTLISSELSKNLFSVLKKTFLQRFLLICLDLIMII